jgi:hypothetical protein
VDLKAWRGGTEAKVSATDETPMKHGKEMHHSRLAFIRVQSVFNPWLKASVANS